MKILLLGPQGSGKGTIGDLLSKELGLPLISNGEVLRALPVSHPRYQEIHDAMHRGELVPQDFLASMLKERTSKEDCSNGFILDGWGRKDIDLQMFDPGFDEVIYIVLSRETSLRRISGRRICKNDGWTCNIYTLPPHAAEHCDKCDGELIQRDDDTEDAVNKRLDIFYKDTIAVIEDFRAKGKLIEVDGEPLPQEVLVQILQKLKK